VSGPGLYPRTLDELLKDPRSPATRRHLRRLYPDPITRSSEWGIIKAPDGGIMGVHSRSEEAPQDFAAATKYSDWKFFYAPKPAGQQQQQKPGAVPPGAAPMPGAVPMPGVAPQPGGIPMPGAAPAPGGTPMPGAAPGASATPMPGAAPTPFALPPSSAGKP
jgi:hypothetical protein